MTCLHRALCMFCLRYVLFRLSRQLRQLPRGWNRQNNATKPVQQLRCSYISWKERVKRWVSKGKRNIAHVANKNEVQFENIRSEICEVKKIKMSHHRASLLDFQSFVNQNVTPQSKFAAFPIVCWQLSLTISKLKKLKTRVILTDPHSERDVVNTTCFFGKSVVNI